MSPRKVYSTDERPFSTGSHLQSFTFLCNVIALSNTFKVFVIFPIYTTLNHIHLTPMNNFESSVTLTVCLYMVGGTWSTCRKPTHAHGKHSETTLKPQLAARIEPLTF